MSTYVTVDIYEDVWLRCDEHPKLNTRLAEGCSMASVADIVKAHNEHAKDAGCGSVLVPEEKSTSEPPNLHPSTEQKLREYYDGRGIG